MRLAARVDVNQPTIVKDLRKRGYRVLVLSGMGQGVPDILIGNQPMSLPRFLVLVELKDGDKSPSRQRLTEDEAEFHREWTGCPVYACNSLIACLAVIEQARGAG